MGRAHETSGKREMSLKKDKKRKDKAQKKLEKKEAKKSNNFDDMIAYVDEFGNISSTPADLSLKEKVNADEILVSVPRKTEESPKENIRTGVVTFIDSSKGYGFIKDSSSRQDVFVYLGNVKEPLKEKDTVTFEIIKTQRGPNAQNVKLVQNLPESEN